MFASVFTINSCPSTYEARSPCDPLGKEEAPWRGMVRGVRARQAERKPGLSAPVSHHES